MVQRNSRNETLVAVLDEIKAVGGSVDRIEKRSHTFVYWRLGDRLLIQMVSSSSCSWTRMLRARADIRRQARSVRDAPLLRCCAAL